VARVAQSAQGLDVLWDVWNEPNTGTFWQGTREQFFETYLRAYGVLRDQLGPDAWIGGPSITLYDHAFLAEFLDFCVANACEVNFLSWHELRSTGYRIVPITDNLADAYASFVDQFVFCDGSVKPIKNTTDLEVLRRLAIRNDGQVIPDY
jgi:xylan 1,4-beta-xylosidase